MSGETVLSLENERLRFELRADGSAGILDRAADRAWRFGAVAIQEYGPVQDDHCWQRQSRFHPEQYPGRFRAAREGGGVRFTLVGRQGREEGTFRATFRLDGAWLVVEIPEIDESLPGLVFPTPIESESLLFPLKQGVWQRQPLAKFGHLAHRFSGNGLNMRWFGGLRGEHGWLCVVEEGYPDAGVLRMGMGAAPLWMKSLDRWAGPRRVRYGFAEGGYVGVAKAFRAWAKANGLFKSLAEKIGEVPAVGKLVGGRNLHFMHGYTFRRARYEDLWLPVPEDVRGRTEGFVSMNTFREAAAIVEDAKRLGMKRGVFSYHGWINGGYDETHPDVWPPEPALGTPEELRALCRPEAPFIACLHDNYQDIYEQSPSFPAGTCRRRDGRPLPGGFWRGGQAYILTGRAGHDYARRNWPRLEWLGAENIYSDTLTAEILKQSWEPGHTQSRAQDLDWKIRTMRFFKEQGVAFSSEDGADFGVPWLDSVPTGKHSRTPGESVPLWALVYHDAVLGFRGMASWTMEEGGLNVAGTHIRCLENMLWGWSGVFGGFSAAQWPALREVFASTFYADEWHARIGTDEMVSHRFLTEDGQVERTEWSSGGAITVNFSAEERSVDGVSVPAHGYAVTGCASGVATELHGDKFKIVS
jgi:hypothetical protein